MSEGIEIYTDGGCHGNPGPGGWAFVYTNGEKHREMYGFEADTTNNRMELTAVIQALEQKYKWSIEGHIRMDQDMGKQ